MMSHGLRDDPRLLRAHALLAGSDLGGILDAGLASALFRDLSQRFEKLSPLQRFSVHLALLKLAPETFRRRLEDSPDEWLAAAVPCVAGGV